ncbi:hypothetical protein GGF31_006454 [Allomyces arbusculus]|nr:hypothetical protein GGF31_006454 [Allomyces arbusculus]
MTDTTSQLPLESAAAAATTPSRAPHPISAADLPSPVLSEPPAGHRSRTRPRAPSAPSTTALPYAWLHHASVAQAGYAPLHPPPLHSLLPLAIPFPLTTTAARLAQHYLSLRTAVQLQYLAMPTDARVTMRAMAVCVYLTRVAAGEPDRVVRVLTAAMFWPAHDVPRVAHELVEWVESVAQTGRLPAMEAEGQG